MNGWAYGYSDRLRDNSEAVIYSVVLIVWCEVQLAKAGAVGDEIRILELHLYL